VPMALMGMGWPACMHPSTQLADHQLAAPTPIPISVLVVTNHTGPYLKTKDDVHSLLTHSLASKAKQSAFFVLPKAAS
jgi:hypothetical protein